MLLEICRLRCGNDQQLQRFNSCFDTDLLGPKIELKPSRGRNWKATPFVERITFAPDEPPDRHIVRMKLLAEIRTMLWDIN